MISPYEYVISLVLTTLCMQWSEIVWYGPLSNRICPKWSFFFLLIYGKREWGGGGRKPTKRRWVTSRMKGSEKDNKNANLPSYSWDAASSAATVNETHTQPRQHRIQFLICFVVGWRRNANTWTIGIWFVSKQRGIKVEKFVLWNCQPKRIR